MKQIIASKEAPAAVGPYSQGVKAGGFVFLAGQIPLDPVSGNIVGTTVKEQTEQVFKNIIAVLKAAGATLDDVVKASVFMVDLNDFKEMNEVYSKFLTKDFPARSTFQVAALPRAARVEIEVIAQLPHE